MTPTFNYQNIITQSYAKIVLCTFRHLQLDGYNLDNRKAAAPAREYELNYKIENGPQRKATKGYVVLTRLCRAETGTSTLLRV